MRQTLDATTETKSYFCRLMGLEDFTEYKASSKEEAVEIYSKEVSDYLERQNPGHYVKDLIIDVALPEEKQAWRIKVKMIHVR